MLNREKRILSRLPVRRRHALVALLLGAIGLSVLPFARDSFAARPAAGPMINIGTKNFGEEYVVSRMYQILLQHAGFRVGYHDLAVTPTLQSALRHGSIDLYPEYTGTGLQVLSINKVYTDPTKTYDTVKNAYQKRFHITWLEQAPMNDTNGVAVTRATANKYHLHTLSDLAKVAGQLTFAGAVECKDRPDCYAGMEKKYGIHFKSFTSLEAAPLRYAGLAHGQYNVIEIFTTDGPLRANHLVVLTDNKHAVFPADHIAPVIRDTVLHRYPRIQRILNKLAPYLTTPTMIKLNIKVVLQTKDPASVARSFLRSKHLI